jgi:hypothetical protein
MGAGRGKRERPCSGMGSARSLIPALGFLNTRLLLAVPLVVDLL